MATKRNVRWWYNAAQEAEKEREQARAEVVRLEAEWDYYCNMVAEEARNE